MLFASILDDALYFGGIEMATKKELIDMLEEYDDDAVVINPRRKTLSFRAGI